MDGGEEAIDDEAERRAVRAQAARVQRRAVLLALVLTALAWLIPA